MWMSFLDGTFLLWSLKGVSPKERQTHMFYTITLQIIEVHKLAFQEDSKRTECLSD